MPSVLGAEMRQSGRKNCPVYSVTVPKHPVSALIQLVASGTSPGFVWADIAFCSATWQRVSPQQAEQLLASYPALAQHSCKSGGATTFSERIVGALLPHAVEHVAIELMARAHPGQAFAGTTTWQSRERGIMQVRLGVPEAAARAGLVALTEAVAVLNGCE